MDMATAKRIYALWVSPPEVTNRLSLLLLQNAYHIIPITIHLPCGYCDWRNISKYKNGEKLS